MATQQLKEELSKRTPHLPQMTGVGGPPKRAGERGSGQSHPAAQTQSDRSEKNRHVAHTEKEMASYLGEVWKMARL